MPKFLAKHGFPCIDVIRRRPSSGETDHGSLIFFQGPEENYYIWGMKLSDANYFNKSSRTTMLKEMGIFYIKTRAKCTEFKMNALNSSCNEWQNAKQTNCHLCGLRFTQQHTNTHQPTLTHVKEMSWIALQRLLAWNLPQIIKILPLSFGNACTHSDCIVNLQYQPLWSAEIDLKRKIWVKNVIMQQHRAGPNSHSGPHASHSKYWVSDHEMARAI